MDFDYWTRLALAGVRAEKVDAILANFRIHESSKTSTLYQRQIVEHLRIFEKLFGAAQTHHEFLDQREQAEAHVELLAARIAYHRAKDATLTRIHAWRHIRAAKLATSPRWILLFLTALGGNRSLQLVDRIHQWYKHQALHSTSESLPI
jgi:MoxR-like ATPase